MHTFLISHSSNVKYIFKNVNNTKFKFLDFKLKNFKLAMSEVWITL